MGNIMLVFPRYGASDNTYMGVGIGEGRLPLSEALILTESQPRPLTLLKMAMR